MKTTSLLAAGFALLAPLAALHAAAAAKPNVVYLLADDLGWGDINAPGGAIATPNLDRLSIEGCAQPGYGLLASASA